jgi:hypothetical protein
VTPVLLAVTLAVAPELWIDTQGMDASECDSAALATAIRTHRPSVFVHPWSPDATVERPPGGAIRVELSRAGGPAHLEVIGPATRVTRALPPDTDCKRTIEVAALIVDGALDELAMSEAAPPVDSLAPPIPFLKRFELGLAVGAGAEQGPQAFTVGLDAEAFARYRFFELTLDVDVGLPQASAFNILPPETGAGTLSISSVATELGLGLAPRFGRNRVSVDVLLGLSVTTASASANTEDALFQRTSQTTTELYTGLRFGYFVDLPLGLFLATHVEERLAPGQASFVVENPGTTTPSDTSATTRTWSFQAMGLLGYRFF